MALAALLTTLTPLQSATPAPSANPAIAYKEGVFTLTGAGGPTTVSVKPGFQPMNMTTGQLWLPVGNVVVTFDAEGLGIRRNNQKSVSTLSSVPKSPKALDQAARDQAVRGVDTGDRTFEVNAVSGFEVVGDKVYLLLRWETKRDAQPWLEALMVMDMAQPTPSASLVGLYDGYTMAKGRVNDKLVLHEGKLVVSTIKDGKLGIGEYDPATDRFRHTFLDAQVNETKLMEDSRFGLTITRSNAGTFLLGLFDLQSSNHVYRAEIRGAILGSYRPSIVSYLRRERRVLLNLMTGAELDLERDTGVESTSMGLMVWSPAATPKSATLYHFGSFRPVARWTSTPAAATPARR